MAHELTIRANGSAEMAFVGETPWHGLGQEVTQGASIGVWAKEAGLNWKAVEVDLFAEALTPQGKRIDFPSSKGLVRSDNKEPLAIVGSGYEVVQPATVLEFFRDLVEGGGWHIHTAGTLRGGRKIWAMASNGESGKVGKGDVVKNNLLLATSLDGSMKTTAALTAVRVVCANTLALALQENGEQVKISHRRVFDATAVKATLGVARESFDLFMQQAREMADTPVTLTEAREHLNRIFEVPAIVPGSKFDLAWMVPTFDTAAITNKESRVVSRCLDLFTGEGMGAGLKTSNGTLWGLFNAVTQHVDHEMGRSADSRLDSAWFGRGNGFKQAALESMLS